MSSKTYTPTPTSSSTTAGSSTGGKIKGAWDAVHGLGEAARGNFNDFMDTLVPGNAGRERDTGAAERGRAEMARGMASLRGTRAAEDGASVRAQAHPPLPPRRAKGRGGEEEAEPWKVDAAAQQQANVAGSDPTAMSAGVNTVGTGATDAAVQEPVYGSSMIR